MDTKRMSLGLGMIFIFSIVLFSISLYFLMGMFRQKKESEALKEELTAIYLSDGAVTESSIPAEMEQPEMTQKQNENSKEQETVSPGLLALHEENKDCIGWLSIPGTGIDYPVMFHPEEKEYYLRRDFYGGYSAAGSLFLSEDCDLLTSDQLIIYGHHMADGTMFAPLVGYKNEEFYREHPVISFDTLYGFFQYEVIAVFCTPVYTGKDFAYYAFINAESEEEFNTYLKAVQDRALYATGKSAAYGEQLLSLSTCEYSQVNGRLVVVAKLISNNETEVFYDKE